MDLIASNNIADAPLVLIAEEEGLFGSFNKALSFAFVNDTGATITFGIDFYNSGASSVIFSLYDIFNPFDLTYLSSTDPTTSIS